MDRVRVQVFLGWTLANLLSELIDEFEETDDPNTESNSRYYVLDIRTKISDSKNQN